jgi:hypothetical protein
LINVYESEKIDDSGDEEEKFLMIFVFEETIFRNFGFVKKIILILVFEKNKF